MKRLECKDVIITTTPDVPGSEIDTSLGLAMGNVVRARFAGRDIIAGLRTLIGGEVDEYTRLMAEARDEAYQRMVNHGQTLGAQAIVNVRFSTSPILQGTSEILCYGTAVTLK